MVSSGYVVTVDSMPVATGGTGRFSPAGTEGKAVNAATSTLHPSQYTPDIPDTPIPKSRPHASRSVTEKVVPLATLKNGCGINNPSTRQVLVE